MSDEDGDQWAIEGRSKDIHMSPSCSSFEVLDPHDPVISRLAMQLFRRTNEYLQEEIAAGQQYTVATLPALWPPLRQDHYNVLEAINRLAITKYSDLRKLAVNLSKTLNEYNDMYNIMIKPLLLQIDLIDAEVSRFEWNAYRLDGYTRKLKARFKF